MHISKQTDYALRTLMFLAMQDNNELSSITQISDAFKISRNHLVKVVHRLGQEGFVETLRGKGGGIRLAKSASHIFVGEIVRSIEMSGPIVDCEDGPCRWIGNCKLRLALDNAQRIFIDALSEVSIESLVKTKSVSKPIDWR